MTPNTPHQPWLICHHQTFPGTTESVLEARRFTAENLEVFDCCDDAVLLVSEGATNAITHTKSGVGGTYEVHISLHDGVALVVVHDMGGATIPCLRPPDEDAEYGRGVRLMDALARRWGFNRGPDGAQVWFELPAVIAH